MEHHPNIDRPRQGSALLVTLAVIVLMTGLVLAFFSRALLNKQIATADVAQSRTEAVAAAALDTLVGDLLEELRAGSPDADGDGSPGVTVSDVTVYWPSLPAACLPRPAGNTEHFANVLKRSANNTPFWEQTDLAADADGPARASDISTDAPARNRSGISPERWNKPALLPNNPADLPDWCLVLRRGVAADGHTPPLRTLADHSPANGDFAVGRFAYYIYHTGGLLDINHAGSSLPAADTRRKGRLFTANLTVPELGISDPAALLNWRNPNPSLDWLTDPANTFLQLRHDRQPQERTFVRRQDLLRYAATHPAVISGTALQYLGTFSRAANAPSWSPPADAADSGGVNGSGNAFAYKKRADQPDAVNRNLPNVRVTTPFTRGDGTRAIRGEPLLKQRFPLSRLALVTDSAAASPDIEKYFSLTRASVSDPWTYRSGAAAILTLGEVAQAGREPDFFELLKAAILNGSLGKHSGSDYSLVTKTFDENKDAQIIQIGANLIDQYDADHHPTLIQFSNLSPVRGVENLPYLDHIYITLFRPNRGDPQYPTLEGWLQFGLWNPHGNAADFTAATQFRILATDGKAKIVASAGPNFTSPLQDFTGRYLQFTASGSTFAEPRLLIPSGASFTGVPVTSTNDPDATFASAAQPSWARDGTSYDVTSPCSLVGFYLGAVAHKDKNITKNPADSGPFQYYHVEVEPGDGGHYPTFALQYQDSGSWRTYETVETKGLYLDQGWGGSEPGYKSCATWLTGQYNLNNGFGVAGRGNIPGNGLAYGMTSLTSMDPRVKRGGMVRLIAFNGDPVTANLTIRPGASALRFDSEAAGNSGFPKEPAGLGFTVWHSWSVNNTFQPACLATNSPTQTSYVTDLDGITRRADGDEPNKVSPLWQQGAQRAMRPLMLNRPFRTVAEMGFAMRGDPWKSLNLFSADSADAALLDLFTTDDAPLTAGRVSLNTPHAPVLKAILRGALKLDNNTSTPPILSNNEAQAIANAILAERDQALFRNPAELATRIGDRLSGLMLPNLVEPGDGYLKTARESAARALAGVADTRTWNVMIDIIAQAGRYPVNARDTQDFLVEGERRYWLHVAIDRHTGKVIARQLEPVYE